MFNIFLSSLNKFIVKMTANFKYKNFLISHNTLFYIDNVMVLLKYNKINF